MVDAPWLSDDEVQQRLVRLDELLERLEGISGPSTDMALEAIERLTEVYGTALARIVAQFDGDEATTRGLYSDELIGHLLLLHGLHPEPTEKRIALALDEVRPHLGGAEVSLAGIQDGVARVELRATGCQSSAGATAASIGDVVLAAAPELAGVQSVVVQPPAAPALIPVESLLRRPVSS